MLSKRLVRKLFFTAVLCTVPLSASQATTFKIATISPDGTAWMNRMRAGAAEIEQRTNGRVQFKFYPGGVMGNDQAVLRKIKVGQLHGGAVSGGSISEVYPDSQVYGFPMMFRSLDEVDYVRKRMDITLLGGLEQHGFVTFGFAEGGFAYVMSDQPIRSTVDFRAQKVWIPGSDSVGASVLNAAGVSPIPLPTSDVLTGLQTGLINAITASPIIAIALQWHTRIHYVTDTPVSYTTALLVIERKTFNLLTPADQTLVRDVMNRIFKEIDAQNRRDNDAAAEVLRKQGVVFVQPSAGELAEWQKISDKAREQLISSGRYNTVILTSLKTHLNEYRKSHNSSTTKTTSTHVTEK